MIDLVFFFVILYFFIILGFNYVVFWLKLVFNGRMICVMFVVILFFSILVVWVSWSVAFGCVDLGSIVYFLFNMDVMVLKRLWNLKDNVVFCSLFNFFNLVKSLLFIS